MENPSSFWKGSEIGLSANETISVVNPFDMPKLRAKNGFVFDIVAKQICKISQGDFIKGFVELDEIWQNSPDLTIAKYREFKPEKEGKTLVEIYPTPYSGRRAYLAQIPYYYLKNKDNEILLDANTGEKIQRLGGIKPPREGSKGKSYFMSLSICAFHNEDELGWSHDWLKPKMTVDDTGAPVMEEAGKEVYKYIPVSCWVDPNYAKDEVIALSNSIIAQKKDIQSVFAFVIAQSIKLPNNPKYKPSVNVDRIVIMGEVK